MSRSHLLAAVVMFACASVTLAQPPKPLFQFPTLRGDNARLKFGEEWVRKRWDEALQYRRDKKLPVLPPGVPVLLSDRVVFRTPVGVSCTATKFIRGEDGEDANVGAANAGELVFVQELPNSLLTQVNDPGPRGFAERWLEGHKAGDRVDLLLGGTAGGRLSTSEKLVYTVTDLALFPPDGRGRPRPNPFADALSGNALWATYLFTNAGKACFECTEVDGADGKPTKGFFLGPPLPSGNDLFVLHERELSIYFCCLIADTGVLRWQVKVTDVPESLRTDFGRRVQAAGLVVAGDFVVCVTNAGVVAAVDLEKRKVAWSHRYRAAEKPRPAGFSAAR